MNYDSQYTNLCNWLNARKPDYNAGLALLLSYTNKPALYKQLSTYKNEIQLRSVIARLLEDTKSKMHATSSQASISAPVLPEASKEPSSPITASVSAPRDKIEAQLHKDWVSLLKQIEDLKQKLYFIGRDAGTGKPNRILTDAEKDQRKEICRLLVGTGGLNSQCLENRAAVNYYRSTGMVPVLKKIVLAPEERKVEGDLYLLKENSRKLVSKLKSKIQKGGSQEDLAEWQSKLQTAEADLKFYQSKMNAE